MSGCYVTNPNEPIGGSNKRIRLALGFGKMHRPTNRSSTKSAFNLSCFIPLETRTTTKLFLARALTEKNHMKFIPITFVIASTAIATIWGIALACVPFIILAGILALSELNDTDSDEEVQP